MVNHETKIGLRALKTCRSLASAEAQAVMELQISAPQPDQPDAGGDHGLVGLLTIWHVFFSHTSFNDSNSEC